MVSGILFLKNVSCEQVYVTKNMANVEKCNTKDIFLDKKFILIISCK